VESHCSLYIVLQKPPTPALIEEDNFEGRKTRKGGRKMNTSGEGKKYKKTGRNKTKER
jgi:hypothetical protein